MFADRPIVVVAIDDDSDVDELFVADIRRYGMLVGCLNTINSLQPAAQTLVDESDEDDDVASAEPQNQDQFGETFLEEIRRYGSVNRKAS